MWNIDEVTLYKMGRNLLRVAGVLFFISNSSTALTEKEGLAQKINISFL